MSDIDEEINLSLIKLLLLFILELLYILLFFKSYITDHTVSAPVFRSYWHINPNSPDNIFFANSNEKAFLFSFNEL